MFDAGIAFRCDARPELGAGHLMRCLTLADELARKGARCTFLCRALPGRLAELVVARGHELRLLRQADSNDFDWREDAAATAAALGDAPFAWIVVDHYGVDARWEREVRPDGCRLLAIDDLADRPHDCDLLLDQNLGREPVDYDGLVPAACRRLIGPTFALLRPQFAARRAESIARRSDGPVRRLLVATGGTDPADATSAALDALATLDIPRDIRLDVVLGSGAPRLDHVRARVRSMPWQTELHVDAEDMAALMESADLCMGAAGGSAWERCCLGLPTLILVVADNQLGSAVALDAAGAAILVGDLRRDGWRDRLAQAIARMSDAQERRRISHAAAGLVDGLGAARVARAMLRAELKVRPATAADAEAVWEWRRAGGAARFYRSGGETPLDDHLSWFAKALSDPARTMLIVEGRGGAFAHVRLDRPAAGAAEAEVAICLAEAARGRGLSEPALELALDRAWEQGIRRFKAIVHEDNAASVRLFSALGFEQDGREGSFLRYWREGAGDSVGMSGD